MSLSTCFQRAAAVGVISAAEARDLRIRYEDMIRDGMSNPEARDRMAKQVQAEANHRERAALLTHLAIDRLLLQMESFADTKGRKDMAAALVHLHENMGHEGSFIQDAKGLQDAIVNSALSEMKDVLKAFKRGAFTGDLRRQVNAKVKARMRDVTREIMGESTGDPQAKALADAWMQTAEKLRTRFNDAGGAIGKLQGGYLPQAHDRLALIDFGQKAWVDYMMDKTADRLDRARMVDQYSGLPLTDSQLRRALETAWDRITTDGYYDSDVSASAQGKGALYTQHMDHRFIHFKTADAWLEYSTRFGNGGDIFAAMMGHIQIMARDIAHMEVFGPNPTRTREYLKQYLRSKAKSLKSNEAVIDEQKADAKRLANEIARHGPEYDQMLDRYGAILLELEKHHRSFDAQVYAANLAMGKEMELSPRAQRYRNASDELVAELGELHNKLVAYDRGEVAITPHQQALQAEFSHLLEEMRQPFVLSSGKPGDLAIGWVEKQIRIADAMWDTMRGGEVGDPIWAARMQSTRNVLSSGSLGSAVFSSITDPAFGQDARLRMGMGMKTSNFARIAILNLKEMITMGSREDAIAAGLGLDSALRTLHRHAREMSGWDHRFWTAWIADRVLTTGLLLPWTQSGKHWFGLDMMRFVAKMTAHDWNALPDSTKRAFNGHGIGWKEWAQLRQAEKHDGMFLRPNEVIALDRTLGERYLQMILRETRHAVPEATVRSSSIISNAAPAGTLLGEVLRSGMQFKGFAFAVMMLHPMRIARELGAADTRGSAAGYAATLFITSTMLGMLALALKDIKDGRDPRKWLDEKTWLDPFYISEAILQAGGLGIFGDFIRASENRLGGGLAGTLAGPLAGKVENAIRIASPGQVGKWLRGKDVTSEEELVRFFRSGVVPFGNHPLTAAIFQRALMDRVQRFADPDAQRGFNRAVTQRMRDYNQGHWWQPGTTAPQRLPDLTRPFATR